jgi:IclR family acetate operon transcriptional repressor
MAVKSNESAGRALDILEAVARMQPIGVSALSRELGFDKSAVQRGLMTLAEKGWIGMAGHAPTQWQLTPHIFTVAHIAAAKSAWIRRARTALERLRDETGENVLLTVPQASHFVVIDVVNSRHPLRSAVDVGAIAPSHVSASGRAVLPYLPPDRQQEMLGGPPVEELRRSFAETLSRGYAVSAGLYYPGLTNIAAPIFEADGSPAGAVVVTGPSERLAEADYPRLGALAAATARGLSAGRPPITPLQG